MKRERILILVSALSCAGMAIAYAFLPERIPLQWSLRGEVNSWGRHEQHPIDSEL